MNELKIIITAANSAAKKAVKEVRDEIEKTSQSAKKNGKSISDSMKTIAKGAAIAVGAVAAVSTALVAFGKSTIEAQKNISKLNAAFQAAGSTTKQAGETYKNLYRFMGDSGAATEAAQQLALITTNEKDLAEWTKILQGVYATMGSTLPIESLAEAANETIKVGTVTGTMADALNWAGVSEDAFNAKLATTTSLSEREALVRSTLNNIYINAANIYERNNKALLANAESQAKLDLALAQAGRAILPLMTAFNNLAATLLTVLRPAFEIVASVIAVFVEYIIIAVKWISAFFSLFTGGGSKAKDTTKEVSNNVKDTNKNIKGLTGGIGGVGAGLNKAAAAAKELKKQTMGFDELNVVSSQDTSSSSGGGASGGGGGGGIEIPDLSDLTNFEVPGLKDFETSVSNIKEKLKSILLLVGLIGGGLLLGWLYLEYWPGSLSKFLAAFKLTAAEVGTLNAKIRHISGTLLTIAGAIMLVVGYSDAWVNGIDWGNFALIMGGVALLITGIGLSFGGIIAAAAGVGAGIALIVLGIKDLITSGISVQNILTIIIGLLGVFAAAWYLATLPIALIVTAIVAVVAAFVILWNECEGFREFWINLWNVISNWFVDAWNGIAVFFTKTIPETFKKVMNWLKTNVAEPISNFYNKWIKPVVDKLIEIVKKLVEMVGALFVGLWNLLKEKVITPMGEGFSALWEKIKEVFSPVVSWFSEVFGKAWSAVKNVFSTWGEFFSGLWTKIKNTFSKLGSSIGSAIGDAVKSGINGVISMIENTINKAIGLINGAIDLINKLPGVSVSKINKLTLPRLAKGGVVDTATIAMIGEAGKEAVVPLENNTEWMDKLADRLAQRNGTPSKIVLTLDGKELGWANINSINNITKQTGSLPLVIV